MNEVVDTFPEEPPPYMGRTPVEMAWEDFGYHSNPYARKIIDRASMGMPLGDEEYVYLFTNYPWHPQYGGQAWANVIKAKIKLEQIRSQGYNIDPNEASIWIDHVFDLAHNTGSLFSKMPDQIRHWLMAGLEVKKEAPPLQLLPFASPEVAKLMRQYMRGTGGTSQYIEEGEQFKKKKINNIVQQMEHEIDIDPWEMYETIEKSGLTVEDFTDFEFYPTMYVFSRLGKHQALRDWLEDMWYYLLYGGASNLAATLRLHSFKEFTPDVQFYILKWVQEVIRKWTRTQLYTLADILIGIRSITTNEKRIQNAKDWHEALEVDSMLKSSSSTAFHKTSRMEQSSFFDFYLLASMDPDKLYPDQAKHHAFLFRHTISKLVEDLIRYIHSAAKEEAKHVSDIDATLDVYINKHYERVTMHHLKHPKQYAATTNWLIKLARNWPDFIQEKNAKRDQHRRVAEEISRRNGHILFPWTCMNCAQCRKCGGWVYLHQVHGMTDTLPMTGIPVSTKCTSHLDNPNGCTLGAAVEEFYQQDYNGATVI